MDRSVERQASDSERGGQGEELVVRRVSSRCSCACGGGGVSERERVCVRDEYA